ncbi:MAG: DUF2628 domain-containing protein [Pirellulales bacterium]|nr:DUF2628 domain-containing protein [Pirellulales bacterium]
MSEDFEFNQPANPNAVESSSLESIEDISGDSELEELRLFVGSRAHYYLRKWAPLLQGRTQSTGFNWAAFFFAGLWLSYRKMYKATCILWAILFVETIAEEVLFIGILGKPEAPTGTVSLMEIVIGSICGIWGNRWYLSHARKVISRIQSEKFLGEDVSQMISKRGGVSLLSAVGISCLCFAINFVGFTVVDTLLYQARFGDVDLLDEKDKTGIRKYEEALVKADQGDIEAESLYTEAIALWEEIFPQATEKEYQKFAIGRLASAHLQLGELQRQLNKHTQAEATLRKAITYYERAVAAEPDRSLTNHNLKVAREMLNGLVEQKLQEQIDEMCVARRFTDAIDLYLQGIKDQEKQARSGKDHEAAVWRLAYRLDQFAWFLAHCPDGRYRDTKSAVQHAQRATELQPNTGDYWYTLAMVQYRNGDWHDSLASLDKVKAEYGEFDATDWLLVAMNLYQVNQRNEARSALRKAIEWIKEQQRKAEDNPLLRFRYEVLRPIIEVLLREAKILIDGNEATGMRVEDVASKLETIF